MATALAQPSDYASATPFPHAVFDDFFEPARLRAVTQEVARTSAPAKRVDRTVYAQPNKWTISDPSSFGSATRELIEELNGRPFVSWLEGLTGISNLVSDPSLLGGGVHRIAAGGFLKVHTDFNWHAGLNLHRRLNVLVYLNERWRPECGGDLELWQPDMSACAVRIAPAFNRLVCFSTTDESYHGHPDPLRSPEGVTRDSIALYYYSAEPAPAGLFGRSQLTNYRERPGERFVSLKHKYHQLRIKLG